MQADIEIYVLSCPTETIVEWLSQSFKVQSTTSESDTSLTLKLLHNNHIIPVTILEKAAGKRFTSIWFDSPNTPWKNDMECAKSAFEVLQSEVRCNFQGWQEAGEEDPDQWWRINANGEGPYIWR
ncbi:hypothetical protein [Marinomonas mediterranea]|uniref:hypothetical protein n=1 Tax=Marinomonas mediterranea TaxID=119864 RepID=UPI0023492CF8|nr:hypothetical protein [Marinomonas mediterranea]WCN08464.1 hypothetical protein GV055_05770 [Marinomonas mediterranea]